MFSAAIFPALLPLFHEGKQPCGSLKQTRLEFAKHVYVVSSDTWLLSHSEYSSPDDMGEAIRDTFEEIAKGRASVQNICSKRLSKSPHPHH